MGKDLPIDTRRAARTGRPGIARGPAGRIATGGDAGGRIAYWAEAGRRIDWISPYTKVVTERFDPADPVIRWYEDGTTNVAYNCLDRHAAVHPDRPALIADTIDPARARTFTSAELLEAVSRFANVLKAHGVVKGDVVGIFLPTGPEALMAMLACARIGAIHAVVFTGYSGKALATRLRDCGAAVLVTADAVPGPDGADPLKAKVDAAADVVPSLRTVLVVRAAGAPVAMKAGRDAFLHEVAEEVSSRCPPEEMNAEDPLFIAYTMGVTGRPKGIVHATGGYLVHVAETLDRVLGGGAGTTVFCTADISHVAAHSYAVYAPLANGAVTILSETVRASVDAERHLALLARHGVDVYYTSPALARDLMAAPPPPAAADAASPATVATFGEALTADVARFLADAVGRGGSGVVDTWWQTESGGILMAGAPGEYGGTAGEGDGRSPSAALLAEAGIERHGWGAILRPVRGVEVALIDRDGRPLEGAANGELVLTASWPSQMRTIHGDHLRFAHVYLGRHAGVFRTGDSALRYPDGGYDVIGRVDEILHIAGHRVPTDEIEHALSDHRHVREAAVVEMPHGAGARRLAAFIVPAAEVPDWPALERDLSGIVRTRIGEFATPAVFHPVRALPRARSGKLVRRILKRILDGTWREGEEALTLSDPGVLDDLRAVARIVPPFG